MFYLNTNDFIPPSCAFTGLCKSCKQTGRLLWCHSRNTRPKGLGMGTHRPGSRKAEGNVRTNHQEMVYNLDVKRNFYVPSYKSVKLKVEAEKPSQAGARALGSHSPAGRPAEWVPVPRGCHPLPSHGDGERSPDGCR